MLLATRGIPGVAFDTGDELIGIKSRLAGFRVNSAGMITGTLTRVIAAINTVSGVTLHT